MSMLPEEIDLNDEVSQKQAIEAEIDKLLGKQVEWANRQGSNSRGYSLPNFCGNVPADVIPNVMKKIKVEYVTFNDEGHGFKKANNIAHALQRELSFYLEIFYPET